MQKHKKIVYAGPKASPKSSIICQSIIACATPAICKKSKHETKQNKKSRMDKGLIEICGPAKAALVRNYLGIYWPCAGGLSAVNAIGTQSR